MEEKELILEAVQLSRKSVEEGGYPVGALVVKNGEILGKGISNGKIKKDATSHAEIEAIKEASEKLGKRDLVGCEMYSSAKPCLMCFSALSWAKIDKLHYVLDRENLDSVFFEGDNRLEEINLKNKRKVVLKVHEDVKSEALDVLESWKRKIHSARVNT